MGHFVTITFESHTINGTFQFILLLGEDVSAFDTHESSEYTNIFVVFGDRGEGFFGDRRPRLSRFFPLPFTSSRLSLCASKLHGSQQQQGR